MMTMTAWLLKLALAAAPGPAETHDISCGRAEEPIQAAPVEIVRVPILRAARVEIVRVPIERATSVAARGR
jgi:hypothetical protein